jgi:hypothetical protein
MIKTRMSDIELDYPQKSHFVPLQKEPYYVGQFNGYNLINEACAEIQIFLILYTKNRRVASQIWYLAQQEPVSERVIGIN